MTNSLDKLAKLSGLSAETMQPLMNQARWNNHLLRRCERHDFYDMTPDIQLLKRYKCRHCGGEINGVAYYWYREGLKHGG